MDLIGCKSAAQAQEFCTRWLPAWTGGDAAALAAFYTEDVFYLDPAIPGGLKGKRDFIGYMNKLLGDNPSWVWTHEDGVPLEGGFLNKWRATIPVGDQTVICRGVCSVQFRDDLICRNEVYFDRNELVTAIHAWNARKNRQ
jgi:hypothetical protein